MHMPIGSWARARGSGYLVLFCNPTRAAISTLVSRDGLPIALKEILADVRPESAFGQMDVNIYDRG
jgi:hypothetical protein